MMRTFYYFLVLNNIDARNVHQWYICEFEKIKDIFCQKCLWKKMNQNLHQMAMSMCMYLFENKE